MSATTNHKAGAPGVLRRLATLWFKTSRVVAVVIRLTRSHARLSLDPPTGLCLDECVATTRRILVSSWIT